MPSAVPRCTPANSRRSTAPTSKTSDRSSRSNGSSDRLPRVPGGVGRRWRCAGRAGTNVVRGGWFGRAARRTDRDPPRRRPVHHRNRGSRTRPCARRRGAWPRRRVPAGYLDVVEMETNLDPLDSHGSVHVDQLGRAFDAAGLALAERRPATARPRHRRIHRA